MMRTLLCSILLILPVATAGAATIDGPQWPAPGGTDFSGSGNPGGVGGHTGNYSNFDPSQYDQLWFGLWWPDYPPQLSMNGPINPVDHTMTYQSHTATEAIWTGASDFVTACNVGCVTNFDVPTRFRITLSGASWQPASDLLAIDPTFNTGLDVVAEVTGDFSRTVFFEVYWDPVGAAPLDWYAAYQIFDQEQTPANVQAFTSFGTGLYSTVPEPGTGLLALLGLTFYAGRRRLA